MTTESTCPPEDLDEALPSSGLPAFMVDAIAASADEHLRSDHARLIAINVELQAERDRLIADWMVERDGLATELAASESAYKNLVAVNQRLGVQRAEFQSSLTDMTARFTNAADLLARASRDLDLCDRTNRVLNKDAEASLADRAEAYADGLAAGYADGFDAALSMASHAAKAGYKIVPIDEEA